MGNRTHFSPAGRDEEIVHGACRPGYYSVSDPTNAIDEWTEHMHEAGIEPVCCLLDSVELQRYPELLESYESASGDGAVQHVPISDYTPLEPGCFQNRILPFLRVSDATSEPVVVHCSAGMGRTGQVLFLGWRLNERMDLMAQYEKCKGPIEDHWSRPAGRELRSVLSD